MKVKYIGHNEFETNAHISEYMREATMTIKIKGMSLMRIKMLFAKPFFLLGAYILGCGIKIEEDNG